MISRNLARFSFVLSLACGAVACVSSVGGNDGGGNACEATCHGCCAPNGTCISPSNTVEACGSAGAMCQVCSGNQTCANGVCVDSSCNGCISGEACVAGNTPAACGTGGVTCAVCGGGQTCTNGSCSGTCQPQCGGKQCGSDGCNGSCGTCPSGQSCNASGQCTSTGGGTVTGTGGTVPSLYFAVIGDTRPGTDLDCGSYPTSIITKIYQNLEAMNPKPSFILTTGDYQYCDPGGMCSNNSSQHCAATQIGDYMTAQAIWTGGPVFSSMGNHECNGYTSSNMTFSGSNYSTGQCDGVTSDNYSEWFSNMVAPLGQTMPYYSVPINATDGSWTAKFINIACNAWDSTQSSWLSSALAQSTTYTFVFRHEDPSANTGPCVTSVDSMLSSASYTMLIYGHSHSFQASPPKDLLVGNGGAGSGPFGYATVQQSGTHFVVTSYDYASGSPLGTTTY